MNKADFAPCDRDHYIERERDCMSFLAKLVKDDGGPGLDVLTGWCDRVKAKMDKLEWQRNTLQNTVNQMLAVAEKG